MTEQQGRWYEINLDGVAGGRPVKHCSIHRAGTSEEALLLALIDVFDLSPGADLLLRVSGPLGQSYVEGGDMWLTVVGAGGEWVFEFDRKQAQSTVSREVFPPAWVSGGDVPDVYQEQALKTWGNSGDSIGRQRLHAVLGLVGETGEVAEVIKKHRFKPGVVVDPSVVVDELADVAYYLAIMTALYGVTIDGLFAHLRQKLARGHGWVELADSEGDTGED